MGKKRTSDAKKNQYHLSSIILNKLILTDMKTHLSVLTLKHTHTCTQKATTDASSLVYCICTITGWCGRLQNSSVCT